MASKDLSDHLLLKECQQGRSKSFDILFERYFNRLYQYALHYIRDQEVAKELVMDVMLRLWERKDVLVIESSLAPYLYKSIKNALSNHWRTKALLTTTIDLAIHDKVLVSRSADYELNSKELEIAYRSKLSLLSPQSRLVFEMSREESMTHTEIADNLNLSVNTVKNHMKAALNFFRKNLKECTELTSIFILFFLQQ